LMEITNVYNPEAQWALHRINARDHTHNYHSEDAKRQRQNLEGSDSSQTSGPQ
jgi:hypothetical protein